MLAFVVSAGPRARADARTSSSRSPSGSKSRARLMRRACTSRASSPSSISARWVKRWARSCSPVRFRACAIRFVRATQPNPQRYPSVPPRLVRLIWEELADGFRARAALAPSGSAARRRSRSAAAYVRALVAQRRLAPGTPARRTADAVNTAFACFDPGEGEIRGQKAQALVAFVPSKPRRSARRRAAGRVSATPSSRAPLGPARLREREVRGVTARTRRAQRETAALQPTPEQAAALERIGAALDARRFDAALLYGVTGSGKTFVYVEAIERVVREGGRAIVLVPEISLTPQTARRFEAAFGDRVAVLHSALSERERFEAWQACARGEIDVVVGARSAVFAPLQNVRLLVVDEAHESSYKQEVVPRYHAVAVARERMRYEGGVLLLGSATPSLESYAAAKAGRLELIELRERATAQPLAGRARRRPRAKSFEAGNRGSSARALVQALGERLAARREEHALRQSARQRGFAALPQLRQSRRSARAAAFRSRRIAAEGCCDATTAIISEPFRAVCPACGVGDGSRVRYRNGTRRGRGGAALSAGARDAHGFRHDDPRSAITRGYFGEFEDEGDVLVGTQMVAKGLDFPTVTLVGVVAADLGLHLPDFRAAERSFALDRASLRTQRTRAAPAKRSCKRTRRIIPLSSLPRITITRDSRPPSCKLARAPAFRRRRA